MKKLTIATIDGCSQCSALKKILKYENIQYEETVCSDDKNEKICDSFEDIAKCQIYPMCIIDYKIFIAFTNDYLQLDKVHTINKFNVIYCYSINNMIQLVKKILY
jgi:glutaredoxin